MLQRPLGHYERFSLARHNVGHTPAVISTALLPTGAFSPSNLLDAIQYLLRSEPLLRSSVAASRSATPRYCLQDDCDPAKVLVEVDAAEDSAQDALHRGIDAMVNLDVERAPLWRVFLYETDQVTKRRRIVLAVHHCLCDGSAARNLFVELLTVLRRQSVNSLLPASSSPFPPSLEDTVDVRPSKLLIIRTLFSMFVGPRLPSFLSSSPTPFWPNPSLVTTFNQPTALRHFFLSREHSAALSVISKSHQARTLQPVFVTTASAVIALAVTRRRLRRQSDPRPVADAPLEITSQSPISLRSSDLGHPLLTGNYISSAGHASPRVDAAYLSTTPFWSEVRSYAEFLNLPSTRQTAKEKMGMLSYLSDAVEPTPDERGRPRTGWEKHLRDNMVDNKVDPWKGGSFEVSNLGRMKDLTEWDDVGGVEEVCWAQPGSGMGIGIAFNTISSGGVLSCTVSWRQDSIETETVEEIVAAYETILTRIAKGEVEEATKLDELV